MKGTLFTSSKNTLVFAAAIIVGALMLVGGEDTPASVAGKTDESVSEPGRIEPVEEETEEFVEDDDADLDEFYGEDEDADIDYADDDDLIDSAEGFDPAEDISEFQPDAGFE